MRITIDSERCTGHAKCWGAVPEIFELDDEGYSHVNDAEVPPELAERVRAAARNCPERAIAIDG